jgi:hypothetical protein
MIDREGHGLFLINMLAGLDGVDEVLAVQMLRGGDDDGVDGLVIEQAAMIEISGCAGDEPLGVVETLSSVPRSPTPIIPMRTRSFAPKTPCGEARVVARPVAIVPMNLRRESMD